MVIYSTVLEINDKGNRARCRLRVLCVSVGNVILAGNLVFP